MNATKTAPATFPTHIDLPEHDRQPLIELINERLADTADLYSQVKQAHWNVKGPNFYQLHLLFDQLAGEVFPYIDLLAERVTALGGVALGTVRMAGTGSSLPEYPVDATDGQVHLKALIERYGVYTANIRKGIDGADKLQDGSSVMIPQADVKKSSSPAVTNISSSPAVSGRGPMGSPPGAAGNDVKVHHHS